MIGTYLPFITKNFTLFCRQNSKPATDYKRDLQCYFTSNDLGEVSYKVAPVGPKGKEKFMATVTVEGTQFKTYPQTYNTRVGLTSASFPLA